MQQKITTQKKSQNIEEEKSVANLTTFFCIFLCDLPNKCIEKTELGRDRLVSNEGS